MEKQWGRQGLKPAGGRQNELGGFLCSGPEHEGRQRMVTLTETGQEEGRRPGKAGVSDKPIDLEVMTASRERKAER